MTVAWSEYDPAWPAQAEIAIAELRENLPGTFIAIEHVGSTSVQGLAAKAIIDLMAAVEDLDDVATKQPELRAIRYERVVTDMPGRLFFVRDAGGRRTHHLHVVTAGTWATRNERLLRDHLRANPDDAARYAELKRRLIDQHGVSDTYTKEKTALIQELVDHARDARGLPRVPVWED